MGDFFGERSRHILFASWQHFSLVAQCLILATIISVLIAVLVYRNKSLSGLANGISAIGLTIPSFALIGLLIV
ncbi:ABC transporter permease, partial [Glutamicibacter arilaitensis]